MDATQDGMTVATLSVLWVFGENVDVVWNCPRAYKQPSKNYIPTWLSNGKPHHSTKLWLTLKLVEDAYVITKSETDGHMLTQKMDSLGARELPPWCLMYYQPLLNSRRETKRRGWCYAVQDTVLNAAQHFPPPPNRLPPYLLLPLSHIFPHSKGVWSS